MLGSDQDALRSWGPVLALVTSWVLLAAIGAFQSRQFVLWLAGAESAPLLSVVFDRGLLCGIGLGLCAVVVMFATVPRRGWHLLPSAVVVLGGIAIAALAGRSQESERPLDTAATASLGAGMMHGWAVFVLPVVLLSILRRAAFVSGKGVPGASRWIPQPRGEGASKVRLLYAGCLVVATVSLCRLIAWHPQSVDAMLQEGALQGMLQACWALPGMAFPLIGLVYGPLLVLARRVYVRKGAHRSAGASSHC